MRAVLPSNESERLSAVLSYCALDTVPEASFDRLTHVASKVFGTPICLITLLDSDRQFFKSRLGLVVTETHRDLAFCSHAILEDDVFVVCDASKDARFADNALVTGNPFIRFYAGAQLKNPDGLNLGTLCVIDTIPRDYPSAEQIQVLEDLSAQVVELLEAGKSKRQMLGLRSDLESMRQELFASSERGRRTELAAALALDAGKMGFWEWDARTNQAQWSEKMFEIMGVPFAGVAPAFSELSIRVHPDDRGALELAFLPRVAGVEGFAISFRVREQDGRERQIRMVGKGYLGAGRDLAAAFGVIWDTTDQHEKERALVESEELFRRLSSSCAVGIFRTDPKGSTSYVNQRLTQIFVREAPELLGSGWQRYVHPHDLLSTVSLWIQTFEQLTPFQHEYRIVLPDGSIRWLLGRAETIHGENGLPLGVVGTIDDITERRRTLDELIAAKEVAEVANNAKNLFLCNVSHEVRTPLNGVIGLAEQLLLTDLSEEQRPMAQMVSESGNTLLKVVDDILDLGRIEAGKLSIEDDSFSLGTILRQTIALNQHQAQKKGLALECNQAKDTPDAFVGDANRIKQILTVFINNALKFTSSGGVTVEVVSEPLSPMKFELLFAVRDTGPGISLEDQQKLFQPFSQLDNTNTRKSSGIGLGLAIAWRLAELMGGSVGVMSVPGEGATFWLRLQLTCRPVSQNRNERSEASSPGELRGHILVAEDNHVNQVVLTGALRRLGWSWDLALDGVSAVNLRLSGEYALVLMDCQMPELDGYEATGQIRAWERETGRSPIPIIALTAHAMTGDRARCLEAGMDDYLSKPIRLNDLRSVLDRWDGKVRKGTQSDFLGSGMLA